MWFCNPRLNWTLEHKTFAACSPNVQTLCKLLESGVLDHSAILTWYLSVNIFLPNTLWNLFTLKILQKSSKQKWDSLIPRLHWTLRTPKHCTSMQNYCSWVWGLRPFRPVLTSVCYQSTWFLPNTLWNFSIKKRNSVRSGIRTHAPERTGTLNQRLRPLGHATCGY